MRPDCAHPQQGICEESDSLYGSVIDQHRTRLFGYRTHGKRAHVWKPSKVSSLLFRKTARQRWRRSSSTLSSYDTPHSIRRPTRNCIRNSALSNRFFLSLKSFFSYSLSIHRVPPRPPSHAARSRPSFLTWWTSLPSLLASSHVTVGSLLLLLRVAERRLLLERAGLRRSTAATSALSSLRTTTSHWASAADGRAAPTPERTFSSQYAECTRCCAYRIHGQIYTCPNSCPM